MNPLDMRTIIMGYFLSNTVCAVVMVLLWRQNRKQSRKRFAGLTLCLADFVLQWVAVLLVALRGSVPDFVSMVVSNTLAIAGTWLLYIGLERFVGKRSPQIHNALLVAVFAVVHYWFAFVHPSLAARNINLSLGLVVLCSQCAWLMLRRVDADLRSITRGAGWFFVGFCLVNLGRVGVELVAPSGPEFFQTGALESVPVLLYQLLFIGITFSLFLMVNRRLFEEIRRLNNSLEQRIRERTAQLEAANRELRGEIVARKRIEATLHENEGRLRATLEQTSAGYFRIGADGRFQEVNAAWLRMHGYTSPEEVIGQHFVLTQVDADVEAAQRTVQNLLNGESIPIGEFSRRCKDGSVGYHTFSIAPVRQAGQAVGLDGFLIDITARRQVEREHAASLELLQLIDAQHDSHALMKKMIAFFKNWSGCEAVGIRLRAGDDFPYFEVQGFPERFLQTENRLCAVDARGEVVRDPAGCPILECMCGNILCGRFDPAKPFFTAHGSFWSNNTTHLLATTTEADRQARTRNRCNGEGYESVALLPLRAGAETLGLVQLNDKRPGRFTPELISQLERLADQVAATLAKQRAEEALRDSEARYRALAAENARLLELSRGEAATKATLLHEVNHRVKNNLSAIIGLLYLEQQYLRAEDQAPYRSLLQDLTGRIHSLALVHTLLSAATWTPILLTDLAEKVVREALAMLPRRRAIQVEVSPSPVRLAPKPANALGLILNELATNALKYAVRDNEPTRLSLRVSQTADEVELEFHDNGPGFPEAILRGDRPSAGLHLVELLVEDDLRGTVAFGNEGGAMIRLRFTAATEAQPTSS